MGTIEEREEQILKKLKGDKKDIFLWNSYAVTAAESAHNALNVLDELLEDCKTDEERLYQKKIAAGHVVSQLIMKLGVEEERLAETYAAVSVSAYMGDKEAEAALDRAVEDRVPGMVSFTCAMAASVAMLPRKQVEKIHKEIEESNDE